ncbi:zinc-dependent metalloprotease, partial [Aerococcus urinae]|nr:zinc-dependent metalloprotease [Aerococcus urinae]
TLEQWERICEPIALNVSRALTSVIENQMGGISGDPSLLSEGFASMASQMKSLTPKLATMMFSSQLGMALTALARETFGT